MSLPRVPSRSALPALSAALFSVVLAVGSALPAAAASPSLDRPVSFAGVTVRVPAAWPVIDVDGVPGCVRYDRHAVYLGSPSESTCPAGLIGRTATVQILGAGGGHTATAPPVVRADSTGDLSISDAGRPRILVTADGVDPELAPAIAAGASIDGATVGTAAVTGAPTAAAGPRGAATPSPAGATAQAVPAPATFSGLAFDACSAPSLTQMDAWQSSPYGAVGVYIGGVSRGCAQPNLTSGWVSAMSGRGWHLLPIYVGLQAPCTNYTNTISTNLTTAKNQGTAAASDAASQMAALGLAAGSPVYLDMESWNDGNYTGSCTRAVMAFTDAWTVGLHGAGYTSGFYSSATTGITALVDWAQAHSTFHSPDAVWFARWDGKAITTDPAIPAGLWPGHQRVKQFQGPHDETYAGRTINIDSDRVDGPVTTAAFGLSAGSVPAAVPGQHYSVQLHARSGVPPYTFNVTGGALPANLSLSSSGVISGTATTVTAGAPVTITVTDKTGATAQRSLSVAVTFTDVSTTNQFFPDIAWLADDGITGGYSDGSFRPTVAVSRQSMAAFLYRYAHDGADAGQCTGSSPFSDVPAGSAFCGDIAWLASTHITGGTGGTSFSPKDPVSRQSMAAFLYRYAHDGADAGQCTGTSPFSDVPATSVFCGDIAWLASTKITQGNGHGDFSPQQAVSRQAMAAFLHRLSELPTL